MTVSRRRFARSAVRLLLATSLVAALAAAAACLVYPPEYVYRVLALRDADADDYRRFPMRRIAPAADAQPLPRRPDRDAVLAAWTRAGGSAAIEEELAALGSQAFIVLRGGAVIHEGYFNGADARSWVTSFSVAKSVLATLVGIAVAEGAIGSLDDPVTRYLPELLQRDPRLANVSLRHLLRMSSGLRYREFPFLHGDDAKTYYHPRLRELALRESRIERPPGEVFHYNNFHPLLLGMVLERATRMPVARYLELRLWQPAGMAGEASWSLDSQDGFEKMESGLNARAEDFARFGLLMLRRGRLGDRQVIPAGWAEDSTAPDTIAPPPGYYDASGWTRGDARRYYQAMWWGQRRADGGHDFAARGNHGQLVFVSPRNDVVIVRHGWRYGMDSAQWFERARRMADELGAASGRP
jgi:CubicO group peptidase (beta-lactamase class C family)